MDIKEGNTEGVAMLFEKWKGGAKTMTAKQMLVDVVRENDDEMLKVPGVPGWWGMAHWDTIGGERDPIGAEIHF